LGQHEIATVQTTAIDPTTGMVNLTTMLAHAFGQWIASDWPVCPIAETANPQRMGAALTYARRYALFTLVGIAPELCNDAPSGGSAVLRSSRPADGHAGRRARTPGNGRAAVKSEPPVTLDQDQSAALRDKLLSELAELTTADLATLWARNALATKNKLTTTDAACVEDAFEQKVAQLAGSEAATAPSNDSSATKIDKEVAIESTSGGQGNNVDTGTLALSKPRRYRNKDHLRYVASRPASSVAASLRSAPPSLRAATGAWPQGQR